jgi:hypothetical protein
MNLTVQIEGNRCFFDYFDAKDDIDSTTGKAGIRCYQYRLWAKLLTIFGRTVELKNQNNAIHYVNKKSLQKFIKRHQVNSTGSYHEQIAEVCKNHINEIQKRKSDFTFEIITPHQKFLALQSRMETSRYFKNFLNLKENEKRSVFINFNDFNAYNSQVINLLKSYLEGRNIEFNEEEFLETLVIGEILKELYAFHQVFDIPEILNVFYEKINFYTKELLDYNGEKLSSYEYWMKIAESCNDENLKFFCKQKVSYMDAIVTMNEKSAYNCTLNNQSDLLKYCQLYFVPINPTTVNLKVFFKNAANIDKYSINFSTRLDFINHINNLVDKDDNHIKISSITFDASNFDYSVRNYEPIPKIDLAKKR